MSSNIVAAIEIGTSRTVLAMGETGEDGKVNIIGISDSPSSGVRKSQITDVGQTAAVVKSVLKKAADDYGISITDAVMVVSGPHIETHSTCGTWNTTSKAITDNDLAELWCNAQNRVQSELDCTSREILQINDLDYSVDDRDGIRNPRGMFGHTLQHNVLAIHCSKACIESTNNAIASAKLETSRRIFSGYCAALSALTNEEREEGALVIEFGGGSTSYTVFEGGALRTTGVVGVGGDHVSNDIAVAFQTTFKQAESLKIAHGAAVVSSASGDKRIELPSGVPGYEGKTISERALHTIINARMEELVRLILETVEASGYLHRLPRGIVITGGGASLTALPQLCSRIFGLNTRVGRPVNVNGIEERYNSPAYATITGALMYACKQENNHTTGGILDFIKRIFK